MMIIVDSRQFLARLIPLFLGRVTTFDVAHMQYYCFIGGLVTALEAGMNVKVYS